MANSSEVSEPPRRTSLWPLFVALGLAFSEVGVAMAIVPFAVGGLLLFVGSVVGILREAGYVDRPRRLLAAFSVSLIVAGAGLAVATTGSIALRGYSIAAAGALALAGSVVWWLRDAGAL